MQLAPRPVRVPVTLLLALVVTTSSCVSFQRWQKRQTQQLREIELEDVAKSWCQTIRASQVVPVYPLTEDLMPGDVFLVQSTVEDQHEEYLERGFLPLDYQIARLAPKGYGEFYGHSVLPVQGPVAPQDYRIPREWMRPGGALPEAGSAWNEAPRAAFPSYSFSVKAGGGLSLAVPVSGVPVGMSLMAAQAASGTISLKQSRTVGLDMLSIYTDLESWAKDHAALLESYASTPRRPTYLRVVTRIYLIGAVDVSLNATQSGGLGLDAGAPKPVSVPKAQDAAPGMAAKTTTEAYAENLTALNKTLSDVAGGTGAPGGSLRVTAASANTVTMHEEFDPPLVLGYLGFDCRVGVGGELGPPVPTRVTLEKPGLAAHLAKVNRGVAIQVDAVNKESVRLLRAILEDGALPAELAREERQGREALQLCDDLAAYIDVDMPVYKGDRSGNVTRTTFGAEDRGGPNGYAVFSRYLGGLRVSAKHLERLLEDTAQDDPARAGWLADAETVKRAQTEQPWAADELRAHRAVFEWICRFGAPAGR